MKRPFQDEDRSVVNFTVPARLDVQSTLLITSFAQAMAEKMRKAEIDYGYSDNWQRPGWEEECRQHLLNHITKGDPIDVAIYCAFMYYHKWSTKQ